MSYKIITPVVTIFDENEEIDYSGNKKVIDFLVNNGVDGILVLGSTGEFTGMSYDEKKEFFKFYIEYVDGRVPLYAGTGGMNYKEVIKLSNYTSSLGYKGNFIIGQYYYGQDQKKIFAYYDRIAKNVKGNIYIYNFPDRTGHCVNSETMSKLIKENNNILGMKDTVSEPNHTNICIRNINNDGIEIYSGFDDQFLYNIASGGSGCIGGLSNFVPDIWSSLIKASINKDFDKTLNYQRLIDKLMPIYSLDCNFSYLFKKLMTNRGLDISTKTIFPYENIDNNAIDIAVSILESVLSEYNKFENK